MNYHKSSVHPLVSYVNIEIINNLYVYNSILYVGFISIIN